MGGQYYNEFKELGMNTRNRVVSAQVRDYWSHMWMSHWTSGFLKPWNYLVIWTRNNVIKLDTWKEKSEIWGKGKINLIKGRRQIKQNPGVNIYIMWYRRVYIGGHRMATTCEWVKETIKTVKYRVFDPRRTTKFAEFVNFYREVTSWLYLRSFHD